MKKTIILTLVITSLSFAAAAQTSRNAISVAGSKVGLADGSVSVELDLAVGTRAARGGRTIIYRPQITDGSSQWTLPEVVVRQGGGRIADERRAWISGGEIAFDQPVFARNGERVAYSARVPYQPWMAGARLVAETIELGCGEPLESRPLLIADNLTLSGAPPAVIASPVTPQPAPATTGDRLAREYRFVQPASEFDRNLPLMMFDEDRRDALTVYFDVGSAVLEPFKNGNSSTLRALLAALREFETSPDSRIAHIVVAGFASPEGSFAVNDRLAANRAAALRRYIEQNSNLAPGTVRIYNGAEDWTGLRQMVMESNLPNRDRVVEIIDLVPVLDSSNNRGREAELMRLDGGRTYRYMLRNFFPELRKAAYIKVFYDNTK
jgi:outer membrane protein OmpA-like peptidoglycan-associated protein